MASPNVPPLPAPASPYGRLFRGGEPWVWATRSATALLLLLVVGIVAVVVVNGLGNFWPRRLTRFVLDDGSIVVGEEMKREVHRVGEDARPEEQVQVRVGNRELQPPGGDFVWLPTKHVVSTSMPEDVASFERSEYGPAYGRVHALYEGDRVVAEGDGALRALRDALGPAKERREQIRRIQLGTQAEANRALVHLDLRRRNALRTLEPDDPERARRLEQIDGERAPLQAEADAEAAKIDAARKEDARFRVLLEDGQGKPFPETKSVSAVIRVDEVNRMSWWGRVGLFFGRLWRFVTEEPREANTDGGVWPALYGTMLMTLLMTIFVVPFGVLAALYLREYAKQGPVVAAVRIAVNNLAGVPSIVFGVFGLGFFCYLVGGAIDREFFADLLPSPTFGGGGILWASLTLALLTVPVVIVATEEALAAVPGTLRLAAIGCGASKWQTITRIVLPHASPGILTGVILAVARGAGEVAPLMLTGVIKSTTELPLDATAPFLHPERKFMHLGFHVYDTGFQSPNVDASTPVVYSTTLLLLVLVLALNLGATILRSRLRRRFRTGVFG